MRPLWPQLPPGRQHMAEHRAWEAAADGSLPPASGAAGPSQVRELRATERARNR